MILLFGLPFCSRGLVAIGIAVYPYIYRKVVKENLQVHGKVVETEHMSSNTVYYRAAIVNKGRFAKNIQADVIKQFEGGTFEKRFY